MGKGEREEGGEKEREKKEEKEKENRDTHTRGEIPAISP